MEFDVVSVSNHHFFMARLRHVFGRATPAMAARVRRSPPEPARCEGHEAARRGELQAFEGPFHEQRLGLRAQNARNHWENSLFCMGLLLSKWMSHTCLQINDHNQ